MPGGSGRPPVISFIFAAIAASASARALLAASWIMSSRDRDILGVDSLRVDLHVAHLALARTVTDTDPPPTLAVNSVAAISACSASIRACIS